MVLLSMRADKDTRLSEREPREAPPSARGNAGEENLDGTLIALRVDGTVLIAPVDGTVQMTHSRILFLTRIWGENRSHKLRP